METQKSAYVRVSNFDNASKYPKVSRRVSLGNETKRNVERTVAKFERDAKCKEEKSHELWPGTFGALSRKLSRSAGRD